MFEDCKTLAELNAARIKAVSSNDIITVNNAYNAARTRILAARNNYTKVNPVFVEIPVPMKFCGIPLAGRSQEPGVIKLTQSGFLF